jgi:hypothetical protein
MMQIGKGGHREGTANAGEHEDDDFGANTVRHDLGRTAYAFAA